MSGIPYFKNHTYNIGSCASTRKGNFYGRNYDWYYDERVSFEVICDNPRYHKSVGISGGLASLVKDNIDPSKWNDIFELIPFTILDGINDAGVVCNVNVVPTGDKGHTTGTNPEGKDLPAAMVVRYVLDHADSAEDAIEKLKERNIFCPSNMEVHFMIADATNTFVIEFVNNKMVIFENDTMTNFYIDGFNGTQASMTPFGSGLERYNILKDEDVGNIENEENMLALMEQVYFTNAYKENVEPLRYTDFVGTWSDRVITTQSAPEDVLPIIERARARYEERTRNGELWQTVHSSVYDIVEKKMYYRIQEDITTTYELSLENN